VIDVEESQVVAIDVRESCLRLISLLSGLVGSDETLRDGEHGSDTEDLIGALQVARGYEHFRKLGIQLKNYNSKYAMKAADYIAFTGNSAMMLPS